MTPPLATDPPQSRGHSVTASSLVQIWADPAKIERVMGWHAQYTDVEESLAHAWAWRKKHPHGYAT